MVPVGAVLAARQRAGSLLEVLGVWRIAIVPAAAVRKQAVDPAFALRPFLPAPVVLPVPVAAE